MLTNAGYKVPATKGTTNRTGQAKDYAIQLQTILDNYNNYGCQWQEVAYGLLSELTTTISAQEKEEEKTFRNNNNTN